MNTSTRKRLCVLHELEDFLQVLITARHSKKGELNGSPMGQQSSACRNAEMSMNIGVNRVVKSCSKSVRTENRNCKLNSTRKIVMTFPVSNRGVWRVWAWGFGFEQERNRFKEYKLTCQVPRTRTSELRMWVGRSWGQNPNPTRSHTNDTIATTMGIWTWDLSLNPRHCASFCMALLDIYTPHNWLRE